MTDPSSSPILISERDNDILTRILANSDSKLAAALEEELLRADVVPDGEVPADVVTMHSKVTFEDQDNGTRTTVTLVYPREANVDELRISILTPVGSALIGLGVGGTIDWPLPNGRMRRLKVIQVEQPAD